MMGSLYAGMSGLKSHQTKMNVIGNNIANVNTIGFKAGRVNFQEALVQTTKGAGRPSSVSGGTNPIQLGLGIQVATIDNLFLQGGLETTGQITDLAIQGQGFFILGDNYGNRFYTRAGAFGFDANSSLVDPATGLFVQGKMADSSGQIPSLATTGPITLPFGQQDPARATEMITMSKNLDASASDALASLSNAGTSNVLTVSGTAANGGIRGVGPDIPLVDTPRILKSRPRAEDECFKRAIGEAFFLLKVFKRSSFLLIEVVEPGDIIPIPHIRLIVIQQGIPCVHAPKTMDLDLQTYSVGGDSTINRISRFINDLKTLLYGYSTVFLVFLFRI